MVSNGKSTNTAEGDVSQQDAKFILECVKNLDRNKQVDLVKVGEALGYTNVASVANRFRLLRKRHGFHNLESVNTSGKGDDKLPAAPAKATGKARSSTMTSTGVKAGETSSESTAEEGEPAGDVKRQRSPQKRTQRKGAKVSSKPIPATAAVTRNRAGSSKSKRAAKAGNSQDEAAQPEEHEGINSYLLDAVDRIIKEEAQADAKMYDLLEEA